MLIVSRVGASVLVIADIAGYLQTRCCFFLMNIHTKPRTIFFARVSILQSTGTIANLL